ncbi:MAG: diguanylate cyclase [Pseudomonadota bacterium]
MDKVKALEQLSFRLSYMAEGIDPEADKILDALRNRLKEGDNAKRIEDLSGKLARAVMTATGINTDKPRKVEGGYDLSGIQKLVKSMPIAIDDHDTVSAYIEQTLTGNTAMSRQKAMVDLLKVSVASMNQAAGKDKGGDGVLGILRKKASDGMVDERYVTLYANLIERLTVHIDVLNGDAVSTGPIRDALEGIVHPDHAQSVFDQVTEEIESIDARIRSERTQTTDFLGGLREKLSGFEAVLEHLTEDGDNSVARSEELQRQVGEDSRQIGEAAKADDLNTIRQMIDQGLANISNRLAEHLEAEQQQNAASKAQVKELNDKLATLEGEAESLRNEIRSASDLAMKDSLTGVYNRAGYEERAAELFARWKRTGAPLSIVFTDCNKFKHINDTYGHAAGDLVLVKVADVLKTRARVSDVVCRYGGDEFVVLLPDTRSSGAEVFAKSAFEEVLNAGFNDNGKPLDVSISCGVTELVSDDSLDDALVRADEAMYKAKTMDGVRVHTFVPE